MDILPDGTLDFDDEVLAELDFVIASIHSSFSQSQDKIMARLNTCGGKSVCPYDCSSNWSHCWTTWWL